MGWSSDRCRDEGTNMPEIGYVYCLLYTPRSRVDEIRFTDQQRRDASDACTKHDHTRLMRYIARCVQLLIPLYISLLARSLTTNIFIMVAAPPSTASKAPAKTPASAKATKKAAKTSGAPAPEGEKKKRRKVRKETYSSYIYKGMCLVFYIHTCSFWLQC